MWGALMLAAEMRSAGREGSIVTLLCDGGERYGHTYYDDGWVTEHGLVLAPYLDTLERYAVTGEWREPA
jgi:cysteine synthase A